MRCTVRFCMTGSCPDAEHGCIARLASVWRRCTSTTNAPSRLPNKNGTFAEGLPAHLWIASLPGHDERSTAEPIANMGTVGFRTNILSGAFSPEHRGGNGDPRDLEHNAPPD